MNIKIAPKVVAIKIKFLKSLSLILFNILTPTNRPKKIKGTVRKLVQIDCMFIVFQLHI